MIESIHLPQIFGVSIEVYLILFLLGLPFYFLFRWIFKKFIKTPWIMRAVSWTAAIFTAFLIYGGLIVLWFWSASYYPTQSFDKDKWSTNKEKRYEMSEDIIKTKFLIGKTKEEVRQILGDEQNVESSDHWNYYLGFRPGMFNIDPDVLDIEFKDGKVVRVGQHET